MIKYKLVFGVSLQIPQWERWRLARYGKQLQSGCQRGTHEVGDKMAGNLNWLQCWSTLVILASQMLKLYKGFRAECVNLLTIVERATFCSDSWLYLSISS